MRYLVPIVILILCLLWIGNAKGADSNWKVSIMGVNSDIVKEKGWGKMILGATASIVTHVVGHYIAAELVGADMHQQGLREIVTNSSELSNSDERWIARGGFALQSLVNTALTSFKATRRSKFTQGYTLTTLIEISTYPMRYTDTGDFHYLEQNGGNGGKETSIFYAIATYNTFK